MCHPVHFYTSPSLAPAPQTEVDNDNDAGNATGSGDNVLGTGVGLVAGCSYHPHPRRSDSELRGDVMSLEPNLGVGVVVRGGVDVVGVAVDPSIKIVGIPDADVNTKSYNARKGRRTTCRDGGSPCLGARLEKRAPESDHPELRAHLVQSHQVLYQLERLFPRLEFLEPGDQGFVSPAIPGKYTRQRDTRTQAPPDRQSTCDAPTTRACP